MKTLLSVVVVLFSVGSGFAQYTVVSTGGSPFTPASGQGQIASNFYAYGKYPSGWAYGYITPAWKGGIRSPDGTVTEIPVTGNIPSAVSATGKYVAGHARFLDANNIPYMLSYRWKVGSGNVEYLQNATAGLVYQFAPNAVSDDGVVITQGTASDNWVYAGVWNPNGSHTTVVVNHGSMAPDWQLFTAWYIENNGNGTYTAKGQGSQNYQQTTNYEMVGPLPGLTLLTKRPSAKVEQGAAPMNSNHAAVAGFNRPVAMLPPTTGNNGGITGVGTIVSTDGMPSLPVFYPGSVCVGGNCGVQFVPQQQQQQQHSPGLFRRIFRR